MTAPILALHLKYLLKIFSNVYLLRIPSCKKCNNDWKHFYPQTGLAIELLLLPFEFAMAECYYLGQGWRTFFGERAKILKTKFSKLKLCRYIKQNKSINEDRPLAQLFSAQIIGAGGLGFKSRTGQINTVSPTARHRCDVSSDLRSPGAKLRRWAPPLVTRLGVIPRVQ